MKIQEKITASGKYSFICNNFQVGANNISADNILKNVFLITDDKLRNFVRSRIENVKSNCNIFIKEENIDDFYILIYEIQRGILSAERKIISEINEINEKIKQLNFYYSENIANKSTSLNITEKVFTKITNINFDDILDYLVYEHEDYN